MSWGSSKIVLWPPSCEHGVMGPLLTRQAEVVLGRGSFWSRTAGPLVPSINKLLTRGNSANGIELWSGHSLEVGVYSDRGWLSVHAEDCSPGGFENSSFQLSSLHPHPEAQSSLCA